MRLPAVRDAARHAEGGVAMRPRISRTVPAVPPRPREGMSPKHEEDVSRCPCIVCGREEPYVTVDPHHLQRSVPATERGTGRRAADRYLIPLCREHHDWAEKDGDDEAALVEVGINGRAVADALWARRGEFNDMREYVIRNLSGRGIYIQ